jgi:FlaA1/EpsC-like NDP-sugar epimerase
MLGRAERSFNLTELASCYDGKRVLITGAAGSVGSALALELALLGCSELTLLDHYDHGLIDIMDRVRRAVPSLQVNDALCDVRDNDRLQMWIRRAEPDVVFHAAALKHVHLGERHASECVLTNLVGTRNALHATVESGAQDFILISSDKAAAPTCVMGATKRLAELLLCGYSAERPTQTRLKAVRFGNVLGSRGSVLPRFEALIEAGVPLEITHPEMERYFMTTDEAVGFILSVSAMDEQGVYFMEMGVPVSIVELGKELLRKSGKPVEFVVTGLRPGEKLKEQLFDDYEAVTSTALQDVFRVSPLSVQAYVIRADVANLEAIARTMDNAHVRRKVFIDLDERLGRTWMSVG